HLRGTVGRDHLHNRAGKFRAAPYLDRCTCGGEPGIGFGEVADMWPVDHRAAEERRLERVVPAYLDQRATDEGDGGNAVPEPHLAEGVGKIDVGFRRDRLALRALRHAPALAPQEGSKLIAARRVT